MAFSLRRKLLSPPVALPRLDLVTIPPGVMMLARAAAWTILACYFPQGKGDKKKGTNAPKPPFFATIMDVAAAHTEEPLIVIGDVNNGHRDRDREGSKFVGPEDFEALSLKSGLVDLWRLTNGDDAREYSWMSAEGRYPSQGMVSESTMPSPITPICGRCARSAITTIGPGLK